MRQLQPGISYRQYCSVLDKLEHTDGTETAFYVPGPLGVLFNHLKTVVDELKADFGVGIDAIVIAFKERKMFALLKAIGFNIKILVKAFVELAHAGPKLVLATFQELNDRGLLKALAAGTAKIDEILVQYPMLKRLGGYAIAGLLLWMWMNSTFTGHPGTDLDLSVIAQALKGSYSITDLFASPSGLLALSLLIVGTTNVFGIASQVTWLGSSLANIVLALAYTGYAHLKDSAMVRVLKTKLFKAPETSTVRRIPVTAFYTGDNGTYCSVVPTKDSQNAIAALAKRCDWYGFAAHNALNYHITVVYSKTGLGKEDQASVWEYLNADTIYTVRPTHVTHWAGHNDKGYVVLECECAELAALNAELRANYDLPTNFDEYRIHITLVEDAYTDADPQNEHVQRLVNELNQMLPQTLYFTGIRMEDLGK